LGRREKEVREKAETHKEGGGGGPDKKRENKHDPERYK